MGSDTRVYTRTHTPVHYGLILKWMDQWFGGGNCSAGPRVRTARGQTGNWSQFRLPEEQREAPQGKARVERGHEGARPPPRLA